MTDSRKISMLLLAIVLLLGLHQDTIACSCASEPPPCEAFSGASAIFVGKVIGAIQQNEYVKPDGTKILYDVGSIRFAVQEAFVGVKTTEVVIHSGTGGGDCGYWFRRGEIYLIYAYGESDNLSTSICTRTRHLAKADEDLAFLRKLPAKGSGGTLYGLVNRYAGDLEHGPFDLIGPMAGLKVIIEGEGRRFEAITDQEGKYRKSGLPPGSYDIRLELPQNLTAISQYDMVDRFGSYSGHEKIKIYDRGCAENSFTVQFDGRIKGRILDAEGRPVKDMMVDLTIADDTEKDWSAWSDSQGHYEFRMVQPGRYFLGVNLGWVPKADYPFPRTYYPGVSEESQARVIGMGEGTKLNGYDIVLPPRLVERPVEGIIIWPDGQPAVGASVVFELSEYPGKSLPERSKVDEKGRFSLKLFDGQSYVLYANIETERGKYTHSDPIELIPTDKTESLKLILTKPGSGYENNRILRKKKAG